MRPIEGYVSTNTVTQRQTIDFHLSAEPPHADFYIQVHRLGQSEQQMLADTGTAGFYATPDRAYETGCSWPSAYRLVIPEHWQGGVYRAQFISKVDAQVNTEILFVVKLANPGTQSTILFQLAVNTYQAYNGWGGKSLYDYNSSDGKKANRVSFNRPDRYDDFYLWEYPFIQWMESQGFTAEYCTNIDLHTDPELLNPYQLLLSVGHDEYWSWEMRDHVESFVANGGNVAFFGGNLCWWQVRYEDDNRTLVCYKNADSDPMRTLNPSRVTTNWNKPIVGRPENTMTGVSFAHGAGWYNSDAGPRPAVGYQVRFADHWVFANTGLRNGDVFGAESSIIGYETDAAVFRDRNGILYATGEQGTPPTFLILATADLSGWTPGGQAGMATLGLYQSRGTVLTTATTDWARGLVDPSPIVSQITNNILNSLSQPQPLFPEIKNSSFELWIDDFNPQPWMPEGAGQIRRSPMRALNRTINLYIDAAAGQTWLTQGPFECEAERYYRISGWMFAERRGATLRLQSMVTWRDFVIAEHSGGGQWEFVTAFGRLSTDTPTFPARVKVEVAPGGAARCDCITVEIL